MQRNMCNSEGRGGGTEEEGVGEDYGAEEGAGGASVSGDNHWTSGRTFMNTLSAYRTVPKLLVGMGY